MSSERNGTYSTLEVDNRLIVVSEKDGALKAAAAGQYSDLPEMYDDAGNLPEVYETTSYRRFVGVALGGGLGGGLSNKSSGTNNTSDNIGTNSSSSGEDLSDDDTSDPNTLLPTTRFTSLNYTDENDIEHYLVHYQMRSKVIFQSAWNSSDQEWVASRVTNETVTKKAIKGTLLKDEREVATTFPITTNTATQRRDFHNSFIQEVVISNPSNKDWPNGGISGKLHMNSDGDLPNNQSNTDALYLTILSSNDWSQSRISETATRAPMANTRLALVPSDNASETQVALYYTLATGYVQELF
ncbi:uncharacterized protein K452DRAFT_313366 [Aplosporella prunicola CBS 121167]|uniref:Uncharacterized protein n=1 Tax=Aplosporella prunicola CBS 121167 TaxID=1176127 RepID=A0A6A6AWX9_9PEZI|nr:uncharacterized protein K452DRAFT_313366 [Aplosporella prunicola CBS 121167]KAF2136240.1 hypothetical protein K452DRAFT_313366 [Aplosporella prunicola CBS 121167]